MANTNSITTPQNSSIEEVIEIAGQSWTLYTRPESPAPYRMRRADLAQDIPFATAEARDLFIDTAMRIANVVDHAPALGTVGQVARQLGLVFTHNPVEVK